ncbi:MAG: hypothetical protein ACR2G2_02065 [Pseudonocardia sp.]
MAEKTSGECTAEQDQRARWRSWPERIRPEDTVAETDSSQYDSTMSADEDAGQREALLERDVPSRAPWGAA